MYKSIFIDLDDTVWAFSENARDTFQDMYEKYHFERSLTPFISFIPYIVGEMKYFGENMVPDISQKMS